MHGNIDQVINLGGGSVICIGGGGGGIILGEHNYLKYIIMSLHL